MANNERVNEQLAGAVRELRDSNLRVASASSAMATAAGGIVKGSKAMAKEIIDKSGLASFKSLPFAGLAASLGGKAFQMMKQKKENRLLELQLGLAKGSAKGLRKEQELVKARQQQLEALKDAATKLGLSGDSITKVTDGIALNDDDQTVGGMSASEVETARASERIVKRSNTLLETIADNTGNMLKSFLGAAAKGGGLGLGVLAGLIAAPVIAIVSFFKTLAVEFKALTGITKSLAGGKLFAPIRLLFKGLTSWTKGLVRIADMVTKGSVSKIGGVLGKVFGGIAKGGRSLAGFFSKIGKVVMKGINFIVSIGTKIVSFFSKFSSFSKGFSGPFKLISKFAAGFGKILGKIFLPITILMSAFDFITGFMDGYSEGGILGGLEGGLSKMFSNLIGMPLDLLKSAVSWIAGVFGFDGVSAALDSFSFATLITDLIAGIFDGVKGVFSFLGDLFTWPTSFGDALGKLVDIVMLPLTLAINFVKGLFGWGDPNEPFTFSGLISDAFTAAKDWIVGIFTWAKDTATDDATWTFMTPIKDAFANALAWVKGIFTWGTEGIANSDWGFMTPVKDAFASAIAWVKGIFSWGEEGPTVKGGITKFIDIILAPYNLAVNWLMGLFGFSPKDLGQDGESFSIGTLLVDSAKKIFDWFKGLFDIDIKGLVNSIPGAGKVLSWFGFGDDEEEVPVEAPAADMKKFEQENEGALNVMEQEEISARMDKFERGKNAYGGLDTQAKYDADMARFDKLVARENELAIANANLQAALEEKNNAGGGSVTQIDNSTTVNGGGQSGGSTRYIPLTDSSNAWQQYSY